MKNARKPMVCSQLAWVIILFLGWFLLTGCRTVQLPPVDFSAAGWTIQQGQAVWKPKADMPELAGEILIATHGNGHSVVHFTKTPFPIVVAQRSGEAWKIEFPPENRSYSGRGQGPSQLLWLHLAGAITSGAAPSKWQMNRPDFGRWLFKHRSGQTLEVVMDLPVPEIYTLRKGDTLGWVARWFDLALPDLMKANPTLDPARMKPGDRLILPKK